MGVRATQPIKRLGAWLVRANNTVYQAATDGFVVAIYTYDGGEMLGYTDGSDPPTTLRGAGCSGIGGLRESLTMPVHKNDYWKTTGATTVYWIPLEP